MNEVWNFDRCISLFTEEIGLLKRISVIQGLLRKAVMSREWDDFDEKTCEVNKLSEKIAHLEDERAQLFTALATISSKGGRSAIEEMPFYTTIMVLPLEERRLLSDLYRELKMETLKMRALNETFLTYLNEAKNITAAYIEAVCPARGGKLYTRKGRRVSQDLKSIVVNNSF